MSKKIRVIMAILILFVILVMHISYAIATTEKSSFFTINKSEISPEETLEMSIDISKIKYNQFKFKLDSNIEAKEIYTDKNTKLNVENTSNDINIEIDKTKMNLNKITLYYVIPKETKIGTKIKLTAQILIEVESNVEKNNSNSTNDKNQISNESNNVVDSEIIIEEKVVEKATSEITVIEKKEESKEESNTNQDKEDNEKQEDTNQDKQENQEEEKKSNTENQKNETKNQAQNTSQNKQMTNTSTAKVTTSVGSVSTSTETAVYNGSSNNYLSNLEIEGITLNTNFSKERGTYFAEVENQTSVNVTAVKEDESAKVCITGNESFKSGKNKILISVTAENGDVRYYRIWVENKSE